MLAWTNVNDAMPDRGVRVLLYGEYETYYGSEIRLKRGITTGKRDEYEDRWRTDAFIGFRVIAWMPLPNPPEGM